MKYRRKKYQAAVSKQYDSIITQTTVTINNVRDPAYSSLRSRTSGPSWARTLCSGSWPTAAGPPRSQRRRPWATSSWVRVYGFYDKCSKEKQKEKNFPFVVRFQLYFEAFRLGPTGPLCCGTWFMTGVCSSNACLRYEGRSFPVCCQTFFGDNLSLSKKKETPERRSPRFRKA